MLKMQEILSIERHIQKTRISGEKVNETAFKVLKEFLTDKLIESIGSRDPKVRRAAVRVSGEFAKLTVDHQKRVLHSMASRM